MFGFLAPGCAYAQGGGGPCTNCAFPLASTRGVMVTADDLVAQFETEVAAHDFVLEDIREVDLYNSGSFLNNDEIPPEARRRVLDRLGGLDPVECVLIESRPEYVTEASLGAARRALGPKRLEVGIGLESAADRIRDKLIHKGFTRADFENSLAVLARHGAVPLAYVLLKPLEVTEREAIEDSVETCRYVHAKAREAGIESKVALQPVFVQPETALAHAHASGRYRPPWLWSVVEVVRRAAPLGPIHVGTKDDFPPPVAVRANCGRCDSAFEAAIDAFNASADIRTLENLCCECKVRWASELVQRDSQRSLNPSHVGR